MSSAIDGQRVPALASPYRLQWEEAQQAFVLLYPEGMVTLNMSAGEILRRCDGERRVDDIINELAEAFSQDDLSADVLEFVEVARDEGWLRIS